ncbi:MAG: hypothetical protein P1S46_04685 [bacterium]|nr:hypothetical protein [bacterium]
MDKKLAGYYLLSAIFLLGIGLAIVAGRAYFGSNESAVNTTLSQPGESGTGPMLGPKELPSFITGKMEPGDIRFELRPEGSDEKKFVLRYFANSHDIVLDDFNLMETVTLETGLGTFRPASATPMRGHHSSGLITFDIEPPESNFTVKVTGLPRKLDRSYKWPGDVSVSGNGNR